MATEAELAAQEAELDVEAIAYSRCVKALGALEADPYNFITGSVAMTAAKRSTERKPGTPGITRVLLSLSARFHCDLIMKPSEPKPLKPAHECNCEFCDE